MGGDKERGALARDVRGYLRHMGLYAAALVRWLAVSGAIGVVCGVLGTLFHRGVESATLLRETHPQLIWALPVAGLAIVAVYRILGVEGMGTDSVIDQIETGEGLTPRLVPAIFAATVATHLAGGSAGREGAALQMGGGIGLFLGRIFRLDEIDLKTATMAGMAAFFSALFGTPVAAAVFAMGVASVGILRLPAFVPCLIASLAAYGLSLFLGVEPTRFTLAFPEVDPATLVRVGVLAALCAMLSVVFCELLHHLEAALERRLPNAWLRALAGGAALLALTLALGTRDYNGVGMETIVRAVEQGSAVPSAFLWKMLFTAITLSTGFKGGEVVPCFFIGATFGCVAGPLLGLDPRFAAAIGLVALFCGAVNCPLASTFLSIELFGAEGMVYFAVACGLAYMLSGYSGLYFSQRILFDKLRADYIDVRANAYHEGGFKRHRI